jgi:ectoine hydroxylase-related dioxygenase (phytanoyl-CoA dioxygenase family)
MESTTSCKSHEDSWAKAWRPLPFASESEKKEFKVLPFEIDQKQKEEFDKRGYIRGPKILSDEHLTYLRSEFERIMKGEIDKDAGAVPYEYDYWRKIVEKHHNNSTQVRKINNAWWINSAVRNIILQENNPIGKAAATLLGTPEIRLWHDQAIWKPSSTVEDKSGNIGWHQDYGFWKCSNTPNMLTAWIPLQDVDMTNGAMRTIVGSHKWGLQEDSATFFNTDMDSLQERFSADKEWIDEPCTMPAGHIVFHHALTFHGSGANTSGAPRLALAVHMMPQDCGLKTGQGWHHNIKDIGPFAKDGDLFDGPCFPVMFKEQ